MEQFVTQTLDWLLPYIAEKGVYFGGAAAFLFYLVQTYSNWNRAGEQTILQKFFSLVLLVAAAGSTGFAFQTFSANYLPKSDAQKASERIAGAFDRCIARTAALDAVVKSGIESKGGHPIDLQCLAFAFQQFQPREASIEEAELLFNDMQLGYKLLHPDAE